jgi:hypothetical protein
MFKRVLLLGSLLGCGFAVIAASLPPDAERRTLPPDVYIEDYYAPPPDFVPRREIAAYTLNTRVPDYFWLRYDGAHTLALRIRPIAREKIEQQIAARLIDPAKNTGALTFFAQIQVPTGVGPLLGDRKPMLWGTDAATLHGLIYRDYAPFKPMEFEDLNDFGRLALRTPAAKGSKRTVADELDQCIDEANRRVRNPAAARQLVRFSDAWREYMAAARAAEEAK